MGFFVGATLGTGVAVGVLVDWGSMRAALPLLAMSTALTVPLFWQLRRARLAKTRTVVVLVAFTALMAVLSVACRL